MLAASYNIRKAVGADLRRRPERILAVLDEIAPDVVVLQEADRRFGDRLSALPPELLEAHGWRAVPFDRRPGSIGWHGNAILVGSRIEIAGQACIEIPALEPRGAVMAELVVEGVRVRVVGMHLDLSGLLRRRQARAVIAALAGAGPVSSILMGDLNEWRLAAGCIADFAVGHHVVPTGPSFPARRPMATLDRIFLSDDLVAHDSGVHRSPLAGTASDHLPAWVRVSIPRPA